MELLLSNLINFALYFFGALISLVIFKFVYTWVTPQDEWKLIKEDKNTAAAIGFGGSVLGFAVALGGVISHSVSLLDFAIWALVALIAQASAFAVLRFVFMPAIAKRIDDGEVSAGIILGAFSVAVGILNAACMTY